MVGVSAALGEPIASGDADDDAVEQERLRSMVDEHFDFIWRTLRGLGVPAASSDDACQQVFLIASRKLRFIAAGCERSFLFATARGVAANARRASARSRETPDESALAHEIDSAPDPEEAASRNQARALLEAILASMKEERRIVFVLYELEGLTMTEIATLLSLRMGTVASRLRRAREHFDAEAKRVQAAADIGGNR
jgi:RNA polymerase sigma-70 factor (ECF subfamily)